MSREFDKVDQYANQVVALASIQSWLKMDVYEKEVRKALNVALERLPALVMLAQARLDLALEHDAQRVKDYQ